MPPADLERNDFLAAGAPEGPIMGPVTVSSFQLFPFSKGLFLNPRAAPCSKWLLFGIHLGKEIGDNGFALPCFSPFYVKALRKQREHILESKARRDLRGEALENFTLRELGPSLHPLLPGSVRREMQQLKSLSPGLGLSKPPRALPPRSPADNTPGAIPTLPKEKPCRNFPSSHLPPGQAH